MESSMLTRRLVVFCFLLFPLLCHAGPLGAPFKVNIYDPGNQHPLDLAAGANGDVMVTWQDQARGGFTFTQRYDWQGNALKSDDWFLGANYGQVGVDSFGWHVILRIGPDGSGSGVYATILDRNGTTRVPEFRVNTTTAGDQNNAAVAVNANGEFAVAWTHRGGVDWVVYARRYDLNGNPLGPETLVGSSGSGRQEFQGIAIDAAGNFVVTWYHYSPANNIAPDVWARRFGSTGAALGWPWRVNTFTVSTQEAARVAMNSQGDFIVTWYSANQAVPNSQDIYAQRYAANGNGPIGGEFLVNSGTAGDQAYAEVGLMDDGSFVVAWTEWGVTPLPRVMARQFWPDGTPVGVETEVSTPGVSSIFPRLALDPAGRFTVAWQHTTAAGADVYARRYVMDTLPPVTTLSDAVAMNNISAATGTWNHYKIVVPAGNSKLYVDMNGAGMPGDANVYVRYGAMPTLSSFNFRPMWPGNTEQFQINNIPPGEWYISIHAQTGYSGVNLSADYFP
jgi:serine protease